MYWSIWKTFKKNKKITVFLPVFRENKFLTLRCIINGGTLINFSIFFNPPELIRTPPPLINFQGMMKYKIQVFYFTLKLGHLHLKIRSASIAAFRVSLAIPPHFVWISSKSSKNFSFSIFQCFT